MVEWPLTPGVISCLSGGALSITQAEKWKVGRDVRNFSAWSTEDKWTCSGGEGWDEIICWEQSLDWVGGEKEGKPADSHEFKEAILQG